MYIRYIQNNLDNSYINYEILKTEYAADQDSVFKSHMSKAKASLSLDSFSMDSLFLRWSVLEMPPASRSSMNTIKDLMNMNNPSFSLSYSCSNRGEIGSFHNWPEIQEIFEDRMRNQLQEEILESPLATQDIDSLIAFFTGYRVLGEKLSKDVQLIHLVYSFESLLDSGMSVVLPCLGCENNASKLEVIDLDKNFIILRITNKLAEVSIRNSFEYITEAIAPYISDMPIQGIEDTIIIVYDRKLKLPTQIEHWRIAGMDSGVYESSTSINHTPIL